MTVPMVSAAAVAATAEREKKAADEAARKAEEDRKAELLDMARKAGGIFGDTRSQAEKESTKAIMVGDGGAKWRMKVPCVLYT